MAARAISVAVIFILLAGVAYFEFSSSDKPLAPPPPVPAVSSCKELKPGMRRIGERAGLQFDVPVEEFTIHEGWGDLFAAHGVNVRPKNSAISLTISWRSLSTSETMKPPDPILTTPTLTSSGNTGKRKVLDHEGNLIGEDSWGDWGHGERWRRIHFLGRIDVEYGSKNEKDLASYGSVHDRDAALFDEVIGSACRVSLPGR